MIGYNPSIVTTNMILCADAGNPRSYPGSGTTWYDASGSDNTGALISSPAYTSGTSGYFTFDGGTMYVNIKSNASILSSTNYTKIAWFYPTSFSTNNNIISGGNTGQHAFWLAGGNKLNAGHNGLWSTVVTSTTLLLNTWYCGAVTFNTTTGWSLYLNGVLENTNASTTTFIGTGDISLAAYGGGNFFTGRLACNLVYNRVLSATEILQNFNALRGRYGI